MRPEYAAWLLGRVAPLLQRHGLNREQPAEPETPRQRPRVDDPQLALFA